MAQGGAARDALIVGGQIRARSLSEMLGIARPAAADAGVTRLAELTHLDVIGLPVVQAVRPRSRSLSTATGRGFSGRAALLSALLEAIETSAAEELAPPEEASALLDLGGRAIAAWHGAPRDALGIRLDRTVRRYWVDGEDLAGGVVFPVPFDLVSQDLTRAAMPDTLTTTVGLASGGSRTEALGAAVAELLEHDLEADWRRASPGERRRCEIDLRGGIDPVVDDAIARVRRAGCIPRLWSLGQDQGLACLLCCIVDGTASPTRLAPAFGSGCHPDRVVAALRAISEAAQGRAAMISGARDDLDPRHYADPEQKRVELVLSTLALGAGPLAWTALPTLPTPSPDESLALVLAAARRRSALPILAVPLASPRAGIEIVKVVAPGLCISERHPTGRAAQPGGPAIMRRSSRRRRLLFVGPTLWRDDLPPAIERRPPAVAGDLARLIDDPPEMVGLVDGCFESGPSVWHKEIVDLIAAGVPVLGAASLGALRAAELHDEGMVGIGRIFAAYRNGSVRRDDAVMVTHAPAGLGYRPLTVSLVDAENAIGLVEIDAGERRLLLRIARTLPFRARTWAAVLDAYRERTGRAGTATQATLSAVPSLKRSDALLLVDALMRAPDAPAPRPRSPLTNYYRRLLTRS